MRVHFGGRTKKRLAEFYVLSIEIYLWFAAKITATQQVN